MIESIKQAKDLAKKWNALESDWERLKFLKAQKGNMKVVLDNDLSMVEFITHGANEDEVEDIIANIDLNTFDDYHGWNDSVVMLFKFAGIEAESC